MDDKKEFKRMFDFPCPVFDLFNYYTSVLSVNDEQLIDRLSRFDAYKKRILGQGFKSLSSYRLDHCLKLFSEESKTWKPIEEAFLSKLMKIEKIDSRNQHHGEKLLSIDIVSANFSVLKKYYNSNNQEFYDDWNGLCEKLGIDPFLSESKSFRQYCFGLYQPKTVRRLQEHYIHGILELLKEWLNVKDKDIIFVSSDEIVLSMKHLTSFEVSHLLSGYTLPPLKFIEYTSTYIDKHCTLLTKSLSDKEKTFIFGVPENRYYMYFKKFISNEPIIEADRYFWNDGAVAIWGDEIEFDKIIKSYERTEQSL